jgi:hypothetical protein
MRVLKKKSLEVFMDWKRSEATRYLCAAAHLDFSFRDKVLRNFLKKPYTALGPSYGIDASVVARHCLAAHRNQLVLDGLLVGLIALALVTSVFSASLTEGALLVCLFVVSFLVVLCDRIRLLQFAVRHLLRSNFDPSILETPTTEEVRQSIEALALEKDDNVVVYSGLTPFVGSGINLRGFSFVVDLSRGQRSPLGDVCQPQSISVGELYDEVAAEIDQLRFDGLRVEDRLYVNGKDVRSVKTDVLQL